MKKNKSLFILIPMAGAIWGLIVFKVVQVTRHQTSKAGMEMNQDIVFDSLIYPKQKKLLLNYKDPFLKNIPSQDDARASNRIVSLFENNPEINQKVVHWPEIVYKGLITSKNKKWALISINQKNRLASIADEFDGMRMKVIYMDSIIIEKDQALKTFYK